jgi:hypothetical protein
MHCLLQLWYNPQVNATIADGSLAMWFGRFPGTGRTCNASRPLWRCSVSGLVSL